MIGIYKIINPKGKIYIGYSKNIERRFKEYLTLRCRSQKFLKESFQTYGVENHIYSIIEECDIENIKKREKYWIEYYNSYKNGLNSNKGGGGVVNHSDESKNKMYKSRLGKKDSLETKIKKSKSHTGKKHSKIHSNKGTSISEETKQKISKSNSKPKPKNFGLNHSLKTKGKIKHSDESKTKISNKLKNHPSLLSENRKKKISESNSKSILQYTLEGNFIREWSSSTCITKELNYPQPNISAACLGKQKTAYGFIWKYK
jgi:group I intron endonuclease